MPNLPISLRRVTSSAASAHPYLAVTAMIAAATTCGLLVHDVLYPANLSAVYLLVVFVTALQWGRKPALFSAVTGAIVFDLFFIPPQFSFAVTDLAYFVTLSVFVVIAIATSEVASRARDLLREQMARMQAEAASEAKDQLLNRIAHELRGPLTTILGWVQILHANVDDMQRTARGLAAVERNAQLLARLVADLLDASRIHVGKLQVGLHPVALAPVVRRALEDSSIGAAEKAVTLETDVKDVRAVLADEHRIEQIVTNLVSNAVKFTPANGRVSVSLCEADGCVRLAVVDTGEGIAQDFIAHVFDPFSQEETDSNHQGLGLGLAIVKHLVNAHHGEIRVESAGRQCGCTFTVQFPFDETHGGLPIACTDTMPPHPGAGRSHAAPLTEHTAPGTQHGARST